MEGATTEEDTGRLEACVVCFAESVFPTHARHKVLRKNTAMSPAVSRPATVEPVTTEEPESAEELPTPTPAWAPFPWLSNTSATVITELSSWTTNMKV